MAYLCVITYKACIDATRCSSKSGDTVSLFAVDSAGNVGPPSTVTVSSTSHLPAQTATLTYDGVIIDRVGPGPGALAPDGLDDAVFELTFDLGAGITRPLSFIELQGPTGRSTRPEVGAGLGVCNSSDLDSPFLNQADGTINAALTSSVSLLLFASAGGFVQAGAVYTVTAVFTNGTRYTGSVTIPATQNHEATSPVFSIENSTSPLNPDEPLPAGTNEATSAVWSVQNQTTPLDPDQTLPAGTNEATSAAWSVQNQTTPLNPDEPLPVGTNETSSAVWSVQNDMTPLNPDEPLPGGSNEASSAIWSVQNLITPLNPDEALPAGMNESTSQIWSVNNDPTGPPPGGQGSGNPDAGLPIDAAVNTEIARDAN